MVCVYSLFIVYQARGLLGRNCGSCDTYVKVRSYDTHDEFSTAQPRNRTRAVGINRPLCVYVCVCVCVCV